MPPNLPLPRDLLFQTRPPDASSPACAPPSAPRQLSKSGARRLLGSPPIAPAFKRILEGRRGQDQLKRPERSSALGDSDLRRKAECELSGSRDHHIPRFFRTLPIRRVCVPRGARARAAEPAERPGAGKAFRSLQVPKPSPSWSPAWLAPLKTPLVLAPRTGADRHLPPPPLAPVEHPYPAPLQASLSRARDDPTPADRAPKVLGTP